MNDQIENILEFIIIIAAFAVFFYINLKKPKTRKQKIRETAIANNWVVTANAVKYDFHSKDNRTDDNTWYVTYEYFIEGVRHKKRFIFKDDFPHSMEVYYLKDNPRKIVFEVHLDHLTTYRYGCLWFFVVLIVLNILMAFLLGKYTR